LRDLRGTLKPHLHNSESLSDPKNEAFSPTFEVGNQVLISSHRKLLSSKAMVVSVAEKSGQEPGRQG
jgi:hypothetical protein